MKKIILFLFVCISLTACQSYTRLSQYPQMYQEKPTTILIMPPINKTVFVEAKEYFYTSLSYPLCEKGYYVLSPNLAMDVFKEESAYDSEMFINGDLNIFKNVFGADAALFTIINSWEKSTLGSSITVNIEYLLRSTTTSETLFNRKCVLTVDCSMGNSGNALVNLAASAINTAVTDKVIAARRCNYYVLQDMPDGKYNPQFGLDGNTPAGKKDFKATVSK